MTYNESYTHAIDGITFNIERATLNLLSIVMADKLIKEKIFEYDLPNLQWAEEIKESEVIRLAVEIAVQYRIMESNVKDQHWTKNIMSVGILNPNVEFEECVDLTVREACNKIIHAETFGFDVQKFRGRNAHYFRPFFNIKGTKGKTSWYAYIDVIFFCNAVNRPMDLPWK
jgi:hypothetical protein